MKTVLVADDDIVTRKVLKQVCEGLGYKVVETKNGEEAWKVFKKRAPSIVISDWLMPEMDGVSLCEKVRATAKVPRPFFFMITGKKKGLANFSDAVEAGVDDFIYKPVDFYVFKNQLELAEKVLHNPEVPYATTKNTRD